MGVSQESERLYVVSREATVQVTDLSGRQLETLKIASYGVAKITTSRDRIYYTEFNSNKIHCCHMNGEEFWQFESDNIRGTLGVEVDNHSNVFVVGSSSTNLSII